jgi:hypothetical protein
MWTVACNSTLSIIEIVHTGLTTGQDLREAASEAISLSKEKGITRFLIDALDVELSASITDVFHLPAVQFEAEKVDRLSRIALVLPKLPKGKEAADFWETACINRGWLARTFAKSAEAIEWLTARERCEVFHVSSICYAARCAAFG